MQQDRRGFLRTALAGAGWGLLGSCATMKSCQEAIANRPVRRNIATMAASDPILVAFKSAIAQMKALPTTDPRNWTRQAQIHNDHCPHGNWLFLPWHRAYLLYFERICRKLSGMADFALPYWNWSTSPSIPAPLWSGQLLDANRVATASSVASASSVGPGVIGPIVNEPNFLLFASSAITEAAGQRTNAGYGSLEGTPHNYIHNFVGGDMGQFMSPLDPVFWTHHNMIERCWVERNFVHDQPNTDDSAWLNREFTEFCDENGAAVSINVATTLLLPVFSYRFDDVGPGAPAAAGSAMSADSKAAQDRNAKIAKAGAKVRLDVERRFAAAQPATVIRDRAAALRITADPEALKAAGHAAGTRTLLAFDGVTTDHPEDFSVHVFVNKPDATADTPPSDPHFAGSFAFFVHAMPGHDHGTGGFVVDATETLQRLGITGGAFDVHLVLVAYPDRQPASRELAIRTTELRLVKDEVLRAP
jgi:tyrosinase